MPPPNPWQRLLSISKIMSFQNYYVGTSLVVQRVRLQAPNAGGPGSIPGRGTGSRMHATTKKSACRN